MWVTCNSPLPLALEEGGPTIYWGAARSCVTSRTSAQLVQGIGVSTTSAPLRVLTEQTFGASGAAAT